MATLHVVVKEFLPIRTAAPSPAQDSGVFILRVSHGAETIEFVIRIYPIRWKSGKKSGGPAYHRDYSFDIIVPARFAKVRCSLLGMNLSTGNEQTMRNAIVTMDDDTFKARESAFITIGDALHQIQLDDLKKPEAALTAFAQNIRRHFANADGPIFYASLLIDDWSTRPSGLIQHKVNACLGMTNNSAYEFEWIVSKQG